MIYIILAILAICVIIWLTSVLADVISYIIVGVVCVVGIILYIRFYPITIPLTGIYIVYKILRYICKAIRGYLAKQKDIRENRRWLSNKFELPDEKQLEDVILSQLDRIKENDENNQDRKFTYEKLPWGRIESFLNYFNTSTNDENVLYFSAIPSADESEIREYGLMITNRGLYFSIQNLDENEEYIVKNNYISFAGLKQVTVQDDAIIFACIDKKNLTTKYTVIKKRKKFVEFSCLEHLCNEFITRGYTVALYNLIENKMDLLYKTSSDEQKIIGIGGIAASIENHQGIYNETKGYLNSNQKAGYAAEYGNNTMDRIMGKRVESTAQKLDEHGRQVKAGADRTVNGCEIQTKYYKTASESIGAAFQNNQAIYIQTDGSGKMMQIEVPRDQYNVALKLMQKRIDSGQIPNVSPGEDARNYVKKGFFTYTEAWNIANAGTVESLTVDTAAGMVSSKYIVGLTATIAFAHAIWDGKNVKQATEIAIDSGGTVLGKSTMIYVLTMQLSRNKIAIPFTKDYTKDMIEKGNVVIDNPLTKISNQIATKINTSSIASTKLGQQVGINNIKGKQLISGAVTGVVVFGPDICKAVQRKISTQQLIKNTAISAGGLVGAKIGSNISPVIGGMIGGMLGSFITKKTLDSFIEDDAKKMFCILKEEFLDNIMQMKLTQEEFDTVLSETLANENLDKMLQNMYQSGDERNYARQAIVQNAIQNVLSQRKCITIEMEKEGLSCFWA